MISIIVPVYKSEKYLSRCVQSILDQTYSDLELILVNDGSPDCSGRLCNAWAEKDHRVRVIHKENGGVSTARNAGLDAATGKYIAFVDSDDWIEPDMYQKMIAIAEQHGCDVVMCDCVKDFSDHSEVYSHDIRSGFYSAQQLIEEYYPHLLMMENIEYPATISSCTILWRSTLNTANQRYTPGVRFSEDLLFGAKLLRKARSFYYMKGDALYHYVMNADSASHTYVTDKWQDYQLLYRNIITDFKHDKAFDFSEQIDKCLLFFLYNTLGEIYETSLSGREKRRRILTILRTSEVRELFRRLNIYRLPIRTKQKVLTFAYKYRLGISLLIAYFRNR